ncbi:DUF4430 domain-containing protein [Oceanobacillus halotolerans]|uniref:DUF4430 domain-containing protein n=1 Tax=Oceanobacillus halotolerans TaxID=2663380 RepID=UPI0013D92085|nr:DUF4430 domain-containing protein [Oceanobacillus halotolerans]
MNKWFTRMLTLFVAIGLLVGCGADDSEEQTENESDEATVVITISEDEGAEVITEKEVAIEENAILMDVMEENFEIEHDNGFITSIDGHAPQEDEQKAWMFFVNDEMPQVGAGEFELTPGDEVNFDLQAWE